MLLERLLLALGRALGGAVELLGHMVLLGGDELLSDLKPKSKALRIQTPKHTLGVWTAVTGYL